MHSDQRVGIFVDVSNLYHAALNLYNGRANYVEILKAASAGRKIIRSIAYVISSESNEENTFFKSLYESGFEVKMKDLQVFSSGVKKGDWDVGIAMDCVRISAKLDVVVLVTGDGDYIPLVDYLKNSGVRVELLSYGKSTSSRLIEEVDYFMDLDSDTKRFVFRISSATKLQRNLSAPSMRTRRSITRTSSDYSQRSVNSSIRRQTIIT